jgi:NADH-quinone oxidoreductase subunit N
MEQNIADITLSFLNFETLVPMLITICGGLFILVADLFKKDLDRSFYTITTILFLFGTLIFLFSFNGNSMGFFDLIFLDGFAILGQIIIVVSSLLFIILALTTKRFNEYRYPEYFALFLFVIAGYQFAISTENLILIFVGLETSGLAIYTMIAMHNRDKSFEAAIKYFTMSMMATGFYAFGAMIFYALTGSLEISQITSSLVNQNFHPVGYAIMAMVFMLGALGFKIAIVPLHTWAPDVYEGASAPLAGYMSIVPKLAGFIIILRIFELFLQSNVVWAENTLLVIIILTMTVANVSALIQTDVKRMLAYSSISHGGFALVAILINTSESNSALFLYWITFMFTNLGAFAMLWLNRHKENNSYGSDHPYSSFSGMVSKSPVAASIMGLFMLSLAGVPPFSIFWGKAYLISTVINDGYLWLALIMLLNSAVSVYYYLKLIVYMFLKEPISESREYMKNSSSALKSVVGISAFLTFFSIFFIHDLLDWINEHVVLSSF